MQIQQLPATAAASRTRSVVIWRFAFEVNPRHGVFVYKPIALRRTLTTKNNGRPRENYSGRDARHAIFIVDVRRVAVSVFGIFVAVCVGEDGTCAAGTETAPQSSKPLVISDVTSSFRKLFGRPTDAQLFLPCAPGLNCDRSSPGVCVERSGQRTRTESVVDRVEDRRGPWCHAADQSINSLQCAASSAHATATSLQRQTNATTADNLLPGVDFSPPK